MLGVDVAHHRFCQEELVTVGTVLPGEGGLRRAWPPHVWKGHVGGLVRGPQGLEEVEAEAEVVKVES